MQQNAWLQALLFPLRPAGWLLAGCPAGWLVKLLLTSGGLVKLAGWLADWVATGTRDPLLSIFGP